MPLKSKLFSGDPRLEDCAVRDAAHVQRGDRGPFVALIQDALNLLDKAGLTSDGIYGKDTAAAVLSYKQKRSIINRSYQTKADDIVGKMTIASMDDELSRTDKDIVCIYLVKEGVGGAVSSEASRAQSVRSSGFAITGSSNTPNDAEDRMMQSARARSIETLKTVIAMILKLQNAIVVSRIPRGAALTDEHKKTLEIMGRWLCFNPGAPVRALPILAGVRMLMEKNIAVKNSSGLPPRLSRKAGLAAFGLVTGGSDGIDNGVECGNSFFDFGGPNCHRDVMTHEFFHFLDIGHGGGGGMEPTHRDRITTTRQALDSADNIAQMISELVTPGGKTDACARRGE